MLWLAVEVAVADLEAELEEEHSQAPLEVLQEHLHMPEVAVVEQP